MSQNIIVKHHLCTSMQYYITFEDTLHIHQLSLPKFVKNEEKLELRTDKPKLDDTKRLHQH